MQNTNIKKKLITNTIVGGVSFLLLLVCTLFDMKNPLGFFSRTSSINVNVNKIITFVVIALVALSVISILISVILLLLKYNDEDNLGKINDFENTLNVVPIVLLIFIFIDAFLFSPVRVSGSSMNDTLEDGNLLVTSHCYINIYNDDIVIVKKEDGDLIIKRVVASCGDTIKVDEYARVFVNGECIETSARWNGGDFVEIEERTLEAGEYYCLGDNRNNSSDSRVYGIFTEDEICGKVICSISPFSFNIEKNVVYK